MSKYFLYSAVLVSVMAISACSKSSTSEEATTEATTEQSVTIEESDKDLMDLRMENAEKELDLVE